MKKLIALMLLVCVTVCVTACAPQSDSTDQNTDGYNQQHDESLYNDVETSDESTDTQSIYSTPANDYSPNYDQNQEPEQTSTTVAVSNAIIVEDNHENNVVYKNKCDACGYIEPGTVSTNPGSFIGGFYCPKCEESKTVELKTTYSY